MKLTLSPLCDVTLFLQKKTFKTILSSRIKGNKERMERKKKKEIQHREAKQFKKSEHKRKCPIPIT